MPSRNLLRAAFLIIRRKAAGSRALPAFLAGFGTLLGFLWLKDSFAIALRAYLFFFPYLFLFLAQDLFREEIDSGALENVVFVNGGFREYLLAKLLILAASGLAVNLALLAVLAACGLGEAPEGLTAGCLAQFAVGCLAGLYYLAAGGYLSFFFRAGSNVLVVIIGQVFLGIGFFLSMTARRGWVEEMVSGRFPGLARKLRFLGLALVFPNAVSVRRDPVFIAGLTLAGLGLFGLVRRRLARLELDRQ
jgi:hypothetical protein